MAPNDRLTRPPATPRWVVIVVVLQSVGLLAVVSGRPGGSTARADGIPDAGAQVDKLIDELKTLNARVDKLATRVERGDVTVRTKPADADKR